MSKPDVQRLLEFHKLLDSFSSIQRVIHIKRHGKLELESDTEHSYNLAMTAWFIATHFTELDSDKIVKLALVHDLVEIHAGDTFAYGEQAEIDSKPIREAAAQKQLAEEWKDFSDLHTFLADYETRTSPEARFVYALDKIMPMFAVYLGGGHTWREHGISLERIHAQKSEKIKVSPEIAPYWDELYAFLSDQPELFKAD